MKKSNLKNSFLYFILITLFSLTINLYSSQNNSGLLQGEQIVTYWNKEKNRVRSIGNYKTNGVIRIGSKIGSWKYFYPNGKPQEQSHYFDGKLNGEYLSFYANGNVKIKGYFTLGQPDSTFEAYFFNGKLAEKGKYSITPKINSLDTFQLQKNIDKSEAIKSFKTGNWSYYYNSGKIMEETNFIDGDSIEYIVNYYDTSDNKLVENGTGKIKTYFPSGKLKSIEGINGGVKNGETVVYKPNGKPRITGYYKNGKMDSLWIERFITSDETYQIKNFKKGEKSGSYEEYNLNGDLNIKGQYFNGKKNGEWIYYFVNNNIDMQGFFKEDQQHGYWKFYYPKGQVYYEGNFINGQKDGEWKFFYNNGNIWKNGIYSHDQKNGLWTTLYENGDKSMEGEFKFDLENGAWKSWYENGQLKDNGFYNEGKMDAHWDGYYKSGQIKYSGDYENDYKINKWTYWSIKGKIIEIRNYKVITNKSALIPDENRLVKKSVSHGQWIKYSEYDGSIKSIENYNNGKLNGVAKYFHPGGVITSREVSYKNGLLDGNYKAFNRKGNLISVAGYKNNKKHGDMKVFSKRGKLISHVIYKDGVKLKDVLKKITFKYSGPKNKK